MAKPGMNNTAKYWMTRGEDRVVESIDKKYAEAPIFSAPGRKPTGRRKVLNNIRLTKKGEWVGVGVPA